MFETKDARFRRLLPRVLYVLVAIVFVPIALRALDFLRHSLYWPLSICLDASILRFESWSMLRGVWPWRDIVSINLPVTHYIHILGLVIFGESDAGFRLMDAALVLGIALLTAVYLLRVSKLAAWVGFCLTLMLPHEATPYGAFQREVLMLPLLLAALWAAEVLHGRMRAPFRREKSGKHPRRPGLFLLLGVLAGLTLAIKPTAVLFFGLFALAAVATAFTTRTTAEALALVLRGALFSGLALALTLALVLAPLLLADPALPAEAVQAWLDQTGAYAAVVEITPPLALLSELFTFQPLNWSIALNQPLDGPTDTGHLSLLHLTLFGLWLLLALRNRRSLLPALFLFAALLQYLLQMRGFQYHLYPVWYGWVLITAIALSDLMQARETDGLKFAALFFALSLVLQQYNSLRLYRGTGLYDRGQPEKVPAFKTPDEIGRIVTKIREYETKRAGRHAGDGDRQSAAEAPLYFQTFEHASIALGAAIPNNLRLASRYPVDYIVWEESEYREPARTEMLAALQQRRPVLLAYAAGHSDEQKARVRDWPALNRWIAANYLRTAVLAEPNRDEYWIFVRRDYVWVVR